VPFGHVSTVRQTHQRQGAHSARQTIEQFCNNWKQKELAAITIPKRRLQQQTLFD
jgi:hypothetical protein